MLAFRLFFCLSNYPLLKDIYNYLPLLIYWQITCIHYKKVNFRLFEDIVQGAKEKTNAISHKKVERLFRDFCRE
jgi:hypothetical protein